MDKKALLAKVVETLTRVYPENDPRARARRFFPLYARIGAWITGLAVLGGAILLFLTDFPLHDAACMFYGMTIIPVLAIGALSISRFLYAMTVHFLTCKDRIFGKPEVQDVSTRDQHRQALHQSVLPTVPDER